jgi:hypothetical protein
LARHAARLVASEQLPTGCLHRQVRLRVHTERVDDPGSGIRTFVVGVPGSEPARTVLSSIAKQGGTAADGCDPQLGNCHFDMTMAKDLVQR